MTKLSRRSFNSASALLAALAAAGTGRARAFSRSPSAERVSLPGHYHGYAKPVSNGFVRSSEYVTVSDGRMIAIDIFHPTLDGEPLPGRRPAVAQFSGYRRSWIMSADDGAVIQFMWPHHRPGEVLSWATHAAHLPDTRRALWPADAPTADLERFADWVLLNGSVMEYLMVHGYTAIVADTRATGASFGLPAEQGAMTIGRDISDVFDALADKVWSDGTFGMVGKSWMGAVQHMAISYGAHRLKAVFPQVAPMDQFTSIWPGGILNTGVMRAWLFQKTHEESVSPALPVDSDPQGTLRDKAMAERTEPADKSPEGTRTWVQTTLDGMSALSRDEFQASQLLSEQVFGDGTKGNLLMSPLDPAHANRFGIPTYCFGGWWDIYAEETPTAFANLTAPKKLCMGPWNHGNNWPNSEALRWFDHWLKHVENRVMTEPPVTYSISDAAGGLTWRSSVAFPPSEVRPQTYSLSAAGALLPAQAAIETRSFKVDLESSSGPGARGWGFSTSSRLDYSTLAQSRSKGLVFGTPPLTASMTLCGYPELVLSVSTSGTTAQVFAYLLMLDTVHRAWLLSQGQLDLKYRRTSNAPYDNLGRPFRAYASADIQPLVPGERYAVQISLLPVGWECPAGSRLMLLITGADKDNAYQSAAEPTPLIEVHCGGAVGSALRLPVLPAGSDSVVRSAFTPMPAYARVAIRGFDWS